MRFLADENVPRPIVERLRRDGFEIFSISEQNAGDPDTKVLATAARNGLILITQDLDFGELTIARGLSVAGVVLLEIDRLTLARQIERVATVVANDGHGFEGQFTVIEPGRLRQRALPKQTSPLEPP